MPSKLSQANRLATLTCANLKDDVLMLRSLHATEQLGRLSTFEIELDSEKGDIKADDLLGHSVVITAGCPAGGDRYFHGIVNHFSHSPRVGRRYFRYRLTAVPWLWLLTRRADCRIFQKKTVPDILADVFQRSGFGSWFENGLHGTYEPWEYCVQYRETDFNFASRLMEQEGIYYYFKHEQNKHTLVLADSPDAHHPFPEYEKVLLRARSGAHGQEDEVLREWQNEHRHHSGAYAQTDYDFMRPKVDLATHNEQDNEFGYPAAEVYDYPGEYIQFKEGEAWAKVRMEEIRTDRIIHHSSGNVSGIAVGHKFALTGPPGFKDDGDYLVTGSSIQFKTAVYQTGGGEDDSDEAYNVDCTLIPAAEPFRAARLTPKPVIQGVQTAVVTGPKGEEIHTDKYGRIKVQFHWDRVGQLDENTTCFIRVGQVWAGKRWGATFLPRIGQEVIVAFLEGDPDQPIVVGSVYNGEQMPPYLGDGPDPKHKNDPKVSGIKSESTKGGAGFNELRFDDNKGSEEIFLHAEKNLDTRVKNDTMETVANSRFLTVGSEKDGAKTGDQFEMVLRSKHLKVHKDQEEIIGGVQKLHVGGIDGGAGDQDVSLDGNRHVLVTKEDHLHVKTDRKQKVDGSTSLTVGMNQQEKVGQNHALDAGQEIHLKAGMKVIIEAGVQLTIKVGGNFVDISPAGVTIKGTLVLINSGGAAGSGSGSSPQAPAAPAEAAPTLPTLADDSKPGFLSSTNGTVAAPSKPTAPPPTAGSRSAGAASSGVSVPGVPGMPPNAPGMPAVSPGFFNCVKNAAKKAEEAVDQGKKTVDEATKAVKAAEDGAHKVEADVQAIIKDATDLVADAKSFVQDVKDTVDHLKKAASEGSVSEVKAAVKSGKDAVAKAKDAVNKTKDAVAKAKDAVHETVTDVKAALHSAESFVNNVKATLDKAGDAFEAAGQCI